VLAVAGAVLLGIGIALVPTLTARKVKEAMADCPQPAAAAPASAERTAAVKGQTEAPAMAEAPAAAAAPTTTEPSAVAEAPAAAEPPATAEPPAVATAPVEAAAPPPALSSAMGNGRWLLRMNEATWELDGAGLAIVQDIARALRSDGSLTLRVVGINNMKKSSRRALIAAEKAVAQVRIHGPLPEDRVVLEYRQTAEAEGIAVEMELTGGRP